MGVGIMEPSGGGAAAEKAGGGGGRGSSPAGGFVTDGELSTVVVGISQPSGISVMGGGKVVVMGDAAGAEGCCGSGIATGLGC